MAKRKNGNPETMPEPPCYLIDLLPRRAPEERAAQYSAFVRYLRREKETKEEGMQGKLLELIGRHRRGITESLRGINVLDVDGETFGLIGDMKRVLALMQEIETKYDKEPHEK